MTRPTFLRATKVVFNTIQGDEDSIDIITADESFFVTIHDAEIVRKDYQVRTEGLRWHPPKEKS